MHAYYGDTPVLLYFRIRLTQFYDSDLVLY
jgi:hypothetical protein